MVAVATEKFDKFKQILDALVPPAEITHVQQTDFKVQFYDPAFVPLARALEAARVKTSGPHFSPHIFRLPTDHSRMSWLKMWGGKSEVSSGAL